MRSVSIGECVEPVHTWNPKIEGPDIDFCYIDIASVSQLEKRIVSTTRIVGSEAPSRARQLVSAGDVLVSTVRPNLNAVAYVSNDQDGATASTGFSILRPTRETLYGRYLFHWVRCPSFITEMVRNATGQSYPAVSDRIVKSSHIPLPPLEEQKVIAATLDKGDALRRLRQQAIDRLNTLSQSIFIEMFPQEVLSELPNVLVNDVSRDMRTGPFGSQLLHSEFTDTGVAVLGIDNVVTNEFAWAKPRHISSIKYKSLKRYTVRGGDVLITIMGTCGRCAVVPDNIPLAINTKHLCCISVRRDKILPEFLKAVFLWDRGVARQLGVEAKGAVMPGLNMGIIKKLKIPLPPMEMQKKLIDRLQAVRKCLDSSNTSVAKTEVFFVSLQQRAFAGEL